MNENFNAFELSPITERGPQAVAPEVFRGIYAMPTFMRIPVDDLLASSDFWVRGLGFIDLFSIPGRVVHLRRWAFQDVLLVPAPAGASAQEATALSVNFAAVMSQIDPICAACEALAPGSVTGPFSTPWNTLDIEVITPEKTRVVFTAAKPNDPDSQETRNLEAAGLITSRDGYDGV